ncbi:MAG: saccharopine dehydrogenase NADP-binding domain-containing protein [Myxococcales bacterium]|nr:saccharopine dehydrogenase NADP-binding domain-containing protein [Myxococcales bacterium]
MPKSKSTPAAASAELPDLMTREVPPAPKSKSRVLIYGANGYTGQLVVEVALKRGLKPIVAGRNRASVDAVAAANGLEARVFELQSGEQIAPYLHDVAVVLHCAGPFARTFRPMLDGCIEGGAHYLDITGEVEVFEGVAARTLDCERRGIVAMPGVGFDVVPSDCLAAHLARRLPNADTLELAFKMRGGRPSHGTLTTMVENLHRGSLIRRDGRLVHIATGEIVREIDFGPGANGEPKPPVHCAAIPWGDVSTAYRTTRIPNIAVFVPISKTAAFAARVSTPLRGVLGTDFVQRLMKKKIASQPAGPSADERANATVVMWGEATRKDGQKVVSRLVTPEGYSLTALTSIMAVERVLAGDVRPGYHTPALAFGPDFVMSVPGVNRVDL